MSETIFNCLQRHRILVAEDNYINQLITDGILSKLSAKFEIVENGLLALERLENGSQEFSLILMDCQMPELDGYEATKQIRWGLAGEKYSQIPIIAVTANAMIGDKEKCLDSGMSDYLAKPINYDSLSEMLRKWLCS